MMDYIFTALGIGILVAIVVISLVEGFDQWARRR